MIVLTSAQEMPPQIPTSLYSHCCGVPFHLVQD